MKGNKGCPCRLWPEQLERLSCQLILGWEWIRISVAVMRHPSGDLTLGARRLEFRESFYPRQKSRNHQWVVEICWDE